MQREVGVLLRAFVEICLLRKRPQDIPASSELLLLVLVLNFVLTLLLAWLQDPAQNILLLGVVDTAVLLLFVWLLLLLSFKPGRWKQTVTAIAGTGALFSAVTLPMFMVLFRNEPGSSIVQFLFMTIFVLIIWNVVVLGHIFRNSLSAPFALGIFVALTYIGTSIYLSSFSRNMAVS